MATMKFTDIDQDFPVAGQDNESAGFRDNFSAIKESLNYTDSTLTTLKETTVKLGVSNQFTKDASLETVKFVGCSEATVKSGSAIVASSGQELNYSSGSYHSIVLTNSTTLDIVGFPLPSDTEDGRYAKLKLEAVLSPFSVITAGSFVVGRTYTIRALGTTDFTAIGAISNTIGITFKATGVGTGNGTAKEARTLAFANTAPAGTIKYSGEWPSTLFVTSETTPVVVEFWSYDGGVTIYARYLGQYGNNNSVRAAQFEGLTVNGNTILGDAETDKVVFKGIPQLPVLSGVTIGALTGQTGMMVFNTTTGRVQAYVPDTGLAGGGNSTGIAGWVNLS
jgi:hypothetical protein